MLEPVIARYHGIVKQLYFRGNAVFANPEIYEFHEAEGMGYAIRLPANSILQSKIGYLLKRPVGRPAHDLRRYFAGFSYQAQSWREPRRVVAKVECYPGELYPRETTSRPPVVSKGPQNNPAAHRSGRSRVQLEDLANIAAYVVARIVLVPL